MCLDNKRDADVIKLNQHYTINLLLISRGVSNIDIHTICIEGYNLWHDYYISTMVP